MNRQRRQHEPTDRAATVVASRRRCARASFPRSARERTTSTLRVAGAAVRSPYAIRSLKSKQPAGARPQKRPGIAFPRRAWERAANSWLAPRNSQLATRIAFTLIELLVTITIIGILAAAILGASQAALGTAKASRTRSTITKLHTLLMDRLATYETRRVEINPGLLSILDQQLAAGEITPTQYGQIKTDLRLFALRELMRLEMPDRWADVDVSALFVDSNRRILAAQPALSKTYQRRLNAISQNADSETVDANQTAECLYMTIMYATGDGEARTQFIQQDIGDVDGDGAPEFLDGWGQPIQFIRWPAGFAGESDLMVGDGEVDHDPLDLFRRDAPAQNGNYQPDFNFYPGIAARELITELRQRNEQVRNANGPTYPSPGGAAVYGSAFRLVPLVYSAGPDADADLFLGLLEAGYARLTDPYAPLESNGVVAQRGTPVGAAVNLNSADEAWKDNIHNHVMNY